MLFIIIIISYLVLFFWPIVTVVLVGVQGIDIPRVGKVYTLLGG